MNKITTNEFSFVLKPSQYGIGVFAAHDISEGTFLRLFKEDGSDNEEAILRKVEDVPETFRSFCINRGEYLLCPSDFGCLEIGWYLNHSNTPNASHKNYLYYALKDIKEGEEVTIDYNSLEEPENAKEYYYKQQ